MKFSRPSAKCRYHFTPYLHVCYASRVPQFYLKLVFLDCFFALQTLYSPKNPFLPKINFSLLYIYSAVFSFWQSCFYSHLLLVSYSNQNYWSVFETNLVIGRLTKQDLMLHEVAHCRIWTLHYTNNNILICNSTSWQASKLRIVQNSADDPTRQCRYEK